MGEGSWREGKGEVAAADAPSATGMESPKVVDNQVLKFDTALKLDAGRVAAALAPR